MQKSCLAGIAVVALGVLAIQGCGGGKSASNERVRIALVGSGPAEYPINARRGAEKAAAEFNADVEFHAPKTGTAAEQQNIIEGLLTKGLKAIAVSPCDAAAQAEFLDGVAGQVQLVTQDSDVPQGSKRVCFVGVDHYEVGRTAGQLVKEGMPEGGRVTILTDPSVDRAASDRRQGLSDELVGQSDMGSKPGRYQLVNARPSDAPRKEFDTIVADVLAKLADQPEPLCLVVLAPNKTPTVLSTIKQAQLEGKVRVIGFDEDTATLQGVKDGLIYGTIVEQPFETGYQSVKILARLARGDRSNLPETGVKILDSQAVTGDNVDEFLAEQKKLKP